MPELSGQLRWVIDLGVGLNTRHIRLADLDVNWLEIEHPTIIRLRDEVWPRDSRELREGCSALISPRWAPHLEGAAAETMLFVAESAFCYWPEVRVVELVRAVAMQYSGAWLAFDSLAPPLVWLNNAFRSEYQRTRPPYRWRTWRPSAAFGAGVVKRLRHELGFSEYAGVYYQGFPLYQRALYALPVARRLYRLSRVQLGRPVTEVSCPSGVFVRKGNHVERKRREHSDQ